MQEIERKFLIQTLPADLAGFPSAWIEQGYLVPSGEIEVRLRSADGHPTLTVKRRQGLVRDEVEIPLTAEQWAELWPLTKGRRLQKRRHKIPLGELTIEIDCYSGRREGLVVAEVEFPSEADAHAFQPPAWFGADVTGNPTYSNPLLAIE